MSKSSLDRILELRALREQPREILRQRARGQARDDYARLQIAQDRYSSARRQNYDSNYNRQLDDEKERREREKIEQQQAFLAKRDETLHMYDQQNVSQRAGISAEAAEQQFGFQSQRDKQQTQSQMDRDTLQHGFQTSRDRAQFGFQTQRDETQQGYTQQNMTQRETFSVASKWQEQIQQARNAGMDFSEKQQQEMTLMEETFRKNVLNNPTLDEGLKQRAMLEHQRKLAGIVPNQKVKTGQQQLQESLQFDERVPGVPFLMGRDSQGNLTFQPLGGGGGGPKQVDPAKQAEEQRKNMLKREETLIKLDKEIRSEIDPDTDTLKYKTQDEIDEEKLKRLAPYERFYTESGLPPHELYQLKAKRDELKAIEKQQKDAKTINMADSLRLRSGDPAAQTAYEANPQPEQVMFPARGPLPEDVTKQVSAMPGGAELVTIREKHSSNSVSDQTVRMAAEVVMKFMLTGDDSDEDLKEALEIMEQQKKGYRIDGQNTPAIFDVGSPAF